MHLRTTKTGESRKVPLHADLVEQGFLGFAATRGSQPLFYDLARHRREAQTHPAEIRAQQLAIWVREAAGLKDRDVAPLHGWRHSWKTIALGAGIEERIRDAITGHKVASVGRKYEAPPVSMLAEAMAKFPRYGLTYCPPEGDGTGDEGRWGLKIRSRPMPDRSPTSPLCSRTSRLPRPITRRSSRPSRDKSRPPPW
jgi:hypothetical protein